MIPAVYLIGIQKTVCIHLNVCGKRVIPMQAFEIRLPMSADRFSQGLSFAEFIEVMTQNQRRIRQMYDRYELSHEDIERFTRLVQQLGGRLYITALVEDWCPDVVLNIPILVHLAEQVPGIELRLFNRPQHPDLREAYQAMGIQSIPIISFFDQDWHEIDRWVERSAETRRQVQVWTETHHPEIEGLRQSSDPSDKDRLKAIFAERFVAMMQWSREGMWRSTLSEIETLLKEKIALV
jgi:hypothetical protein